MAGAFTNHATLLASFMHSTLRLLLASSACFSLAPQTWAQLDLPNTDIIAGWEFSQFGSAGFNNTVSAGPPNAVNSLAANFSDFAPGDGAGADANPFGTWTGNGSPGSPTDFAAPVDFTPVGPSLGVGLLDNIGDRPDPAFLTFDPNQITTLNGDGQNFASDLAMSPTFGGGTGSFDFSATPGAGGIGPFMNWGFQFAAVVDGGGDYTFDVEFAVGDGDFMTVDSVLVTATESVFSFTASDLDELGTSATEVTFRMNFNNNLPDGTIAALVVDNVIITGDMVPEPSTYALVFGALALGLAGLRRRKS